MAANKDEERKRQGEYAGIAVLPVTHSNEIVVTVKQSLAAGRGPAFLAMGWKAWETGFPWHLPACPEASPSPGGKVVDILTPSLQGEGNLLPFSLSEP